MRKRGAFARPHLLAIAVLASCLAAASVAATVASGKGERGPRGLSAQKTVRIAALLGSTANTYDAGELVGIKAAAAKFGGKVTKVFGANFDPTTQSTQVQDATTAHAYDVFIIEPQSGNVLVPQIKAAVKAGIKVVCLLSVCGSNPNSTARQIPGYVTTVGLSFQENGTDIAKAIVAACGKTNPCKVAYEPGDLTFFGDVIRVNAINAYLKNYPHVQIAAKQEGKYSADTGRTAMQNMLQAHPDINVGASSGDQMTLGMEQAVKGAGLTGKVLLVGNGAGKPGVAAVAAGRWFATVANLPYVEGYLGTKYAIMASRGTPLSKIPSYIDELKYSPVGTTIITKANASKFKAQWAG
jgi:ribose transport system substrate-binding protein